MKRWIVAAVVWCGVWSCGAALAQPAEPIVRVRGVVEGFDGASLTVKDRGGETVHLRLAPNFAVSEVLPIDPATLTSGTYVGVAAMPTGEGRLQAIEVTVFPEAARGAGEGHSNWDLVPGSTMTNATVAEVAAAPSGRSLTLRYKDGEKQLTVPDGVPVVTFRPADASLLVAGAKVVVIAQVRDGKPTALRTLAGRNGFAPPQ